MHDAMNDACEGRAGVGAPHEVIAGALDKEARLAGRNGGDNHGGWVGEVLEEGGGAASALDGPVHAPN